MIRPILWRCIALLLLSIFLVLSATCSTMPTIQPTSSEVATMTVDPISIISPVSIPLSGEWSFSVDKENIGEQQGWKNPDFDDSAWVTVQVPHTWNVMPEYSEHEGFAWYRRKFTAPVETQNAHLRLRF